MTREGYERLWEELRRLKGKERQKASLDIEQAREHGDLSENAEYDAAKDRQGHLEAKIRDLETKLAQAEVIDLDKLSHDKVVFGATVVLEDLESGEEMRLQIVGQEEADMKLARISVHSPMARAMIGKEVDDEVVVKAPGGTRSYKIKELHFV